MPELRGKETPTCASVAQWLKDPVNDTELCVQAPGWGGGGTRKGMGMGGMAGHDKLRRHACPLVPVNPSPSWWCADVCEPRQRQSVLDRHASASGEPGLSPCRSHGREAAPPQPHVVRLSSSIIAHQALGPSCFHFGKASAQTWLDPITSTYSIESPTGSFGWGPCEG